MSQPEGRYLTITQIAADLRVSRMTAYRLVHNGELEAIRVGRSIRVPREAYEAYLRGAPSAASADASAAGLIGDVQRGTS
jgi:excisionase family DNA binding protein